MKLLILISLVFISFSSFSQKARVQEENFSFSVSANANSFSVEIPYAKKIPTKATTRVWEVIEDNDSVYVWFDKNDTPADPSGQRFN